ncbi:poly-beta-1,6-N-acetyl-D-glucosamine biosynthesis protein PgaD [Paenalcaligenes niemegkensis]|uniref:poly-beta-1,6-N-acetyl-D-glucosamine biosynthesis protein PgaD n=1 Tax=Paenalcaligenes niemegkensis TaxID=2895469 RepID=UPI001EE8851B|nr:poly-beta-1,6-N-acetyl-D-glucosamine biosynthesis protein PgaD [Paenalcaligenes niemegkensis]MCQ9616447.1 poly-beta-1,6-N-acetyl-D-glucosamine biosynthesis protein PgaD [Paenalcaligenes niemegkensis]
MIIRTRRHPVFHSIDLVLTSLGWIAFAWLITNGIVSLLIDSPTTSFLNINPVLPALSTLSAYAMVAAINTGLLALWAQSHRRFGKLFSSPQKSAYRPSLPSPHPCVSLYGIDPLRQNELRQNRYSVIHHNATGQITRVETAS